MDLGLFGQNAREGIIALVEWGGGLEADVRDEWDGSKDGMVGQCELNSPDVTKDLPLSGFSLTDDRAERT